MRFYLGGLAVLLRIGIDEVVKRRALLIRAEAQVAARGELQAIVIVSAEEIDALFWMFPRFRSVYGDPADPFDVELRPAMIAGNLSL